MPIKTEPIFFKGQDERGFTGEIDTLGRSGQFILAYRIAGSVSGNHYHKGLSPAKNPEILFLLEGLIKLKYATVLNGVIEEILEMEIEAPSRIEISALTWHELIFEEDSCFLELNSFAEGDKDTFRLGEIDK